MELKSSMIYMLSVCKLLTGTVHETCDLSLKKRKTAIDENIRYVWMDVSICVKLSDFEANKIFLLKQGNANCMCFH